MKQKSISTAICCFLVCCACSRQVSDEAFAQESISQDCPKILSINELLFDPLGDGVDYVELVNVSSDSLNLLHYCLGNRNSKAEIANVKSLPSVFVPPGGYVLICSDTVWVSANYHLPDTARVAIVKALPSYANAGGAVVLLNTNGDLVDEFAYHPDYHHPLVSDAESLSLEKLHPALSSYDAMSWTSAAVDAGGGTPGFRNSQFRPNAVASKPDGKEGFSLLHEQCRPAALSADAQVLMRYRFAEPRVADIRVYDLDGVLCKSLANNILLGSEGIFAWQGTDDAGEVVFPGMYVVSIQAFSLHGDVYSKSFAVGVLP